MSSRWWFLTPVFGYVYYMVCPARDDCRLLMIVEDAFVLQPVRDMLRKRLPVVSARTVA